MNLAPKGRPYTPLSNTLKPLHPWCDRCGWRKGGVDSWNGRACKCGQSLPPLQMDAEWEESTGFYVNELTVLASP